MGGDVHGFVGAFALARLKRPEWGVSIKCITFRAVSKCHRQEFEEFGSFSFSQSNIIPLLF
jgi:hypothetical protein